MKKPRQTTKMNTRSLPTDEYVWRINNMVIATAMMAVIGMFLYFVIGAPTLPSVFVWALFFGAVITTLFNTVVLLAVFLLLVRIVNRLLALETSAMGEFIREGEVWMPAVREVLGRKWKISIHDMTDEERVVLLRAIIDELRRR